MLIETDFQENPFIAVPRHVVAMVGKRFAESEGGPEVPFSAEALGVLVWLALRPRGAQIAVPAIMRATGLGKDRWQRVARELRAVGALSLQPVTCLQSGRVLGKGYAVRWPDAKLKATAPKAGKSGSRVAVKPKAGKSGSGAGKSGSVQPGNPAPSSISKDAPGFGCHAAGEGEAGRGRTDPERVGQAASGGGRFTKQDGLARMGLAVRCPDSGEWMTATDWQAKRGGLASADAMNVEGGKAGAP